LASRPLCHPKPLRLPVRRKTMTIAAGFICKDGILLCADREESSGASIKAVEKLVTLHVSPWTMTVATAGSGPAGDLAVKRL
jgi:20S proteasome alpha/beta subunit